MAKKKKKKDGQSVMSSTQILTEGILSASSYPEKL